VTNKPELWCCLYDIHFPQYDQKTFRAILSFIRQNHVDGLLLGGDALDLGCVSHWNANLPGTKRKGELKSDLDGFDKEILQPIEALLPRSCQKVFLTGNHERMLDQDLSESMPELDGMLDFKQYLRLADRGFTVVPLGGEYRIGDLLCIHGEVVGSGDGNAAKKAVEIYCQNVLMGHGHQLQASSKCSPSSNKKKICAWMSPIVGFVSPRYLKPRANAWVNGFTLVYVRDNGTFNLYPTVITDGVFSFGPVTYSHKDR
jgi:Calcineurin-like phosphoesterase